ncbi:MAG: hypothetical protein ACR2M8_11425 [Pyrinomonadaceae bacterium]|nr:hypothetical protein [Blastocatellia bacterium]MDQ3491483.1 hypothetical protein [Acidobacteriota bacterium]
MNSEELEVSLRTEFESYLKGVLADMRQDVSKFQKNFEAEFEKHKSQMDEAFRSFSARFESDNEFDEAFTQSVVEHLRLARDEGATITATAIGEAEKLKDESAPAAKFDELRDAINEISGKTSQAEILKSLVDQASNFTSRGAFFLVKNEHFVGWKAFGKEAAVDENVVCNVQFPVSADTLLANAAAFLKTTDNTDGGRAEDSLFLDPLEFGKPDRMYAIPLTARGRGVAVLYADYGSEGVTVNVEALETLVRVAGLTVELLAASQAATVQQTEQGKLPTTGSVIAEHDRDSAGNVESQATAEQTVPQTKETAGNTERADEEYSGAISIEEPEQNESENAGSFEVEDANYFEPVSGAQALEPDFAKSATEESLSKNGSSKTGAAEPSEEFPQRADSNGNGHAVLPAVEPVVEAASASTASTRYNDRHVDLPIEVSDDEKRFHTDARRFARLLVSEIKLYNEQEVADGRESGNLYDRLREAIDRSRDMYNKRVQTPVASKFDYFHYELVNSLAEGEDEKLGESYPGAEVLQEIS